MFVVALDIATMNAAELAGPVIRAVYPGYVQVKEDTGRIYSAFVRVWGLIALLAIPSAVKAPSPASLIAEVVLGPQWAATAPCFGLVAGVPAGAQIELMFVMSARLTKGAS